MDNDSLLSKVMKIINKVGNAILLNVVFLLTCLPIITIGPAWCGLLSAVRYEVRGDRWFEGFKVGVRTRFLRSMIAGILGYAATLYFANNAAAAVHALMDGMGGWASTVITFMMLLMTTLVLAAALATNVYFDRPVNVWTEYAVLLIQKAPLQVFASAALMWLPIGLAIFDFALLVMLFIAFLAVYFTMAGLMMTGLMKGGLLQVLYEDRARFSKIYEDEHE